MLGADRAAARTLYRRFGKTVYVVDDDCPIGVNLLPYVSFHRVPGMNGDLTVRAVGEIASGIEDGIPVVSAAPKMRTLLSSLAPALESIAIVSREGAGS